MAIRVLGPLDTGNEPALSPRERAVLAALIVYAGRAVAPGELAEAYWGERTPRTWSQQVKTAVARIRAGLGAGSVITRGSEYTLGLDPATIDAFEFERLVSAARQHALHDEHDRAVDAYRRALALWRGSPYPELADWEPAAVESERLTEIRDSAEEELLESRLAEGEHRSVIADAERLVRARPLRESRWAILAMANYRAGRQAEALATVRAARVRLSEELGIDLGHRLRVLEASMLQQDPALTPARTRHRVSDDCPYRGLSAFSPDDADVFFGREDDVAAIRDRALPGSLTTVVGASGSGKSSLVLAGVLPRISGGRRAAVVTAGRDVAAVLRARIAQHGVADIVVVDQVETIFQLDEREQEDLCTIIADAVAAGATVLMTLRSDFLDRATGLPRIGGLIGRGVYAIGPLTADGLREAIEQPAARAGLRLEPGLVELILRDAGDRRATLPHVSHALVETWIRREGATLTVAGYEASGGIAGAIAQSAETLYRSLEPEQAEACHALLLRLVQRGPDGASVRRIAHLEPLVDDTARRRVLDRLIAARLLTVDGDTVMVAHEAVARAWPRLDGWLERDAASARVMALVASAAELWDADGRRDEDLLRGARLQAAIEWAEGSDPDLTASERALIDESSAHEQSELRTLADHAAHEARSNRRLRWTLTGAGVLLVAAVVSGGVAISRGRDAAAAAEDRLIEATTSRSLDLTGTDRAVAALMAVAAWQRWPDDARTRAALLGTMSAAAGLVGTTYIPDTTQPVAAAPIPGTRTVALVRDYDTLEVRDVDDGSLVRSIPTDFPRSRQEVRPWIRVSADGSTILVMQHVEELPMPDWEDRDPSVDRDEMLYFFDTDTGAAHGTPVHVEEWSETVDLSHDGRFATWASAGTTVIVDRDTGALTRVTATVPAPTEGVTSSYAASAFRPDGRIVATNIDDRLFVVDPATGRADALGAVPADTGGVGLAVADDGTMIVARDSVIAGLDPAGAPLWRIVPTEGDECSRMTASAVQRLVVCGTPSGRIVIRSLDTGELASDPFDYQLGDAGEPVLTDDETEVWFMNALSPSIGRMRIDGGGPASTSFGGPDAYALTGTDPSGRYVVLGSRTATERAPDEDPRPLTVWDTATASAATDLTALTDPDPWRTQAFVVAATWIAPARLFLVFHDPRTDNEHYAIYDVANAILTRAVLDDTIERFFTATGGRLYGLISLDDDTQRTRLVRYDQVTLRRVGAPMDLDGIPVTVSATSDGSRVVVTTWSSAPRPWQTRVFDATGEVVAEGLDETTRTVVTGDRVIASDVSGLLSLTLDLEPAESITSKSAWFLDLSVDDAGRLLLTTAGGRDGLTVVDLASGRMLGQPIDVYRYSEGSSIDADGGGFVASGDRGAQYRTLDPAEQAAAACRLAGRELTPEEWQSFLADLGARHPLCEDLLATAGAAPDD
ncbi:BTAD domain-containing putative transcriptional regulator [Microbacterium sp. NPDC058389]|uniref:nSTAND1 domain-containing NTPase n=1 Tax=Microbacterium sp. NPDC058389 TaxID=3346475 RepID=UPI003651943B